MTKKGVAISLYDKFDDLAVLVDIIRENWDDEYYIAVCSSHNKGKEMIENLNLNIDEYIDGSEIEYTPDMDENKGKINLHSRIASQFRDSTNAVAKNTDYVMHVHADAWLLQEEKYDKIIKELENREKKAAVRGKGISFRDNRYRIGHIMDQFIFFDSNHIVEENLLDFDPLEMMPDAGIHTILSILFLGRLGLGNIFYYSYRKEDEYWDGRENPVESGVRPGIYNEKWGLLHLAKEDFPKNYGKELQAVYLQKNNLKKGENIQNLLDSSRNKDDIIQELAEIEDKLNRSLRILGYRQGDLDRQFKRKKEILRKPVRKKIKFLLKNVLREAYIRTHEILYSLNIIQNERFSGPRSTRYLYPDAEWPQRYTSKFENLDRTDFPSDKFWFENFDN